jgi:hypothetical protein
MKEHVFLTSKEQLPSSMYKLYTTMQPLACWCKETNTIYYNLKCEHLTTGDIVNNPLVKSILIHLRQENELEHIPLFVLVNSKTYLNL